MSTYKHKVVSLFAGAMGLDNGLEQMARFTVIACIEKERAFCETIEANKRCGNLQESVKIFNCPIEKLDPHDVLDRLGLRPGEVDLLTGGPPCQSFSTTGKRGTTQDPRGTLLWQFLRFVDVIRPRFFLMENVRGLLSAALRHRPIAHRPDKGGLPLALDEQPGSVVRAFAEDLQKLDGAPYHMDCFEVNAVNYGAPQLRERAIFIGNRFNAVVDFPDPTHGPFTATTQRNAGQQYFADFGQTNVQLPWRTLKDAIGELNDDNPEVLDFSPRKKAYLALIPPGSNWRSLPVDLQKESMGTAWHAKGGRSGWWRRLTFDLPSPTLLTMPNHAGTSLCHPTELRALSLKEYAAIQEFPDNWQFCGSTAEKYAQIGNAVPVRLGRVAGEVIAAELDKLSQRQWESYSQKPNAYRIKYIQSHIRTRQWFKAGTTLIWQEGQDNTTAKYNPPKTKRKQSVLREGE